MWKLLGSARPGCPSDTAVAQSLGSSRVAAHCGLGLPEAVRCVTVARGCGVSSGSLAGEGGERGLQSSGEQEGRIRGRATRGLEGRGVPGKDRDAPVHLETACGLDAGKSEGSEAWK